MKKREKKVRPMREKEKRNDRSFDGPSERKRKKSTVREMREEIKKKKTVVFIRFELQCALVS